MYLVWIHIEFTREAANQILIDPYNKLAAQQCPQLIHGYKSFMGLGCFTIEGGFAADAAESPLLILGDPGHGAGRVVREEYAAPAFDQ